MDGCVSRADGPLGVGVIAGWLLVALAQEPEPTEPAPPTDDGYELVVWGPAAIRQARSDVVRAFGDAGWRKGKESDGRVIFRPPEPWMGRAVLQYDGTLWFRRPVLAFRDARAANPVPYDDNPHFDRDPGGLRYPAVDGDAWALPHPEASFWFLPSRGALEGARQRLIERVEPSLGTYRDVVERTREREAAGG